MPKLVHVSAQPGYRIHLEYDDGVTGEADLSHLAGRGVFRAWDDPTVFRAVRLGEHGEVKWGDEIDLCPDALYLGITGKSADSKPANHPRRRRLNDET
jgi:hypothetical protein